MLNIPAGTCFHSATRAFVRSGTDVGPGSQTVFQFIPKVFDGVEVKALCRPVKFFHTHLDKPFLYGPRFVQGGIVMLKQDRGIPQTVATRKEA